MRMLDLAIVSLPLCSGLYLYSKGILDTGSQEVRRAYSKGVLAGTLTMWLGVLLLRFLESAT